MKLRTVMLFLALGAAHSAFAGSVENSGRLVRVSQQTTLFEQPNSQSNSYTLQVGQKLVVDGQAEGEFQKANLLSDTGTVQLAGYVKREPHKPQPKTGTHFCYYGWRDIPASVFCPLPFPPGDRRYDYN